ncbi:class I SAM-dependent methyltransferase [Rubellimicrobium arenae]|uniref:class I SAM-dependent methyltransferase n=1 Tax=Rubellimicrobium arenae TaxID=2817372 RepID=UPI001B314D5A
MTPLATLLAERIAATGPMTVAEYMGDCLLHPRYGYYATRDPLGASGDFTTSPEISQMFGELLGLCLAQAWLDQGAPSPVLLAEIGPGRGTLMADVLRATRRVPGFHAALSVHLVEASPVLRAEQARRVPGARWHDRIEELPEGPLLLLANEFFDALPIRQFLRVPMGWAERVVGLAGDRLAWGLRPLGPVPALEPRLADTRDGEVVELCPALPGLVAEIGRRIATHGGAAVIVDYGDWRLSGDTFQAVARHAHADPLEAPGEADLTAHVDFATVAQAAAPARATPMVTQGDLLLRLGIAQRAEALAQNLEGDRLTSHLAALRRLTHAEEMGTLFKAIGLYPAPAPMLPGFA